MIRMGLLSPIPASNDSMYNVAKPTAEQFADCCNEFYWCMNNVAKGIARRQLPYAMWMLYNSVVHPMLIKLLSYRAAMELFSRTAATVAEVLDYEYRQDWEQAIRDYIEYIKNGYTN